jgi:hypothetical protein
MKTMKSLSHNNQSLGQDLKSGPPEYEERVSLTDLSVRSSVRSKDALLMSTPCIKNADKGTTHRHKYTIAKLINAVGNNYDHV